MTGLFAAQTVLFPVARYIAQESVAARVLFFALLSFWAGPNNFILVLGALALYSFWIQDPVANEWGQIASSLSATLGPGSEHERITLAWKSWVLNKCGSTASLRKQVEDEHEVQSAVADLRAGAGEPKEENVSLQDETDTQSPAEEPAEALSEQPVELPVQTPEPSAVENEAEKFVPKLEASQGPVPPPITSFGQSMPGNVQEQAFSHLRTQQPPRPPRTRSQMAKGVRPTIRMDSVLRKGSLAARKRNTPASDIISIAELNEVDAPTDSVAATLDSEDTPDALVSDRFSIPGAYEADPPTNKEPRPESPPPPPPSPPAITESSRPKDKDPQVLPSESPKKLSVPSHGVAEELRVAKTDVGALLRSKSTKVEAADSLLPEAVSAETSVKAVSHKLEHSIDTATPTVSAEISVKAVSHKLEYSVDIAPLVSQSAAKLKSTLVDHSIRRTRQSLSSSTTNPILKPAKKITFADEAHFDTVEGKKFPGLDCAVGPQAAVSWPPVSEPNRTPELVSSGEAILRSDAYAAPNVPLASEVASNGDIVSNINTASVSEAVSSPQPDAILSIDALVQVSPAPEVGLTAENPPLSTPSKMSSYIEGTKISDATAAHNLILSRHEASGYKHPAFAIIRVEGLPGKLPRRMKEKCDYFLPPEALLCGYPAPDSTFTEISAVLGGDPMPAFLWDGFGPELTSPHELQCGLHAICQALQNLGVYEKGMYSTIKERLHSLENKLLGWDKKEYAAQQMNRVMVDLYGYCIATVMQRADGCVWYADHGNVEHDVGKPRLYIYQNENHYENIGPNGRHFKLVPHDTPPDRGPSSSARGNWDHEQTVVAMALPTTVSTTLDADTAQQGKTLNSSFTSSTGLDTQSLNHLFGNIVSRIRPQQRASPTMHGVVPTRGQRVLPFGFSAPQVDRGNFENIMDVDEQPSDDDCMNVDHPDQDTSSDNAVAQGAQGKDIEMLDAY